MRNPLKYYCVVKLSKLQEALRGADKARDLEKQLEKAKTTVLDHRDEGNKQILDEARQAFEFESEKRLKLVKSLVKFRDQLLMFKENAENEEVSKLLSSLYRETGRFMEQSGIEVLNKCSNFSTDFQTVVETVATDRKELVNTVQSTFRDGYIVDGRMLRPQEVVVYVDRKII